MDGRASHASGRSSASALAVPSFATVGHGSQASPTWSPSLVVLIGVRRVGAVVADVGHGVGVAVAGGRVDEPRVVLHAIADDPRVGIEHAGAGEAAGGQEREDPALERGGPHGFPQNGSTVKPGSTVIGPVPP